MKNIKILTVVFSFLVGMLPMHATMATAQVGQGADDVGRYNIRGASGAVLNGYDPVAYFVLNRPTPGDPEIATEWGGFTWYFANDEHRQQFLSDPERYAPQYGGFCAYAAANNAVAGVDPRAFSIVDDKLYLNFSRFIHARWNLSRANYIQAADRYWPRLSATAQ